jgi:3',5'-cyclic AMP phosphodiesterase CpdA
VTIVHISDLHFPCVQEKIAWELLRAIHDARPSLVVISGDLTQRGRERQYQRARQFLDELPKNTLVVPGNHDVPLYDLLRRFYRPTERFTRLITPDLAPTYRDEQMVVVGTNSTRAFTLDIHGFWKNGTLSDTQLEMLRRQFAGAASEQLKVLVMHHPLVNPWNERSRDTARGRKRILRVLETIGVDLVLSGHLHRSYTRHAPLMTEGASPVLCIQAGTGSSTRLRGEGNGFNLIGWNGSEVSVKLMRYDGEQFEPEQQREFRLR